MMTETALRERLTFRVLGHWLAIETDDARVAAYVRGAFARLLAEPPPGATVDEGALLLHGAAPIVRFGDEPLALDAPASEPFALAFLGGAALFRRSFVHDVEHVAWYAAGVAIDGRGVLFSAPSKTGKTTLALELLRRGHGLFGDEYVFVRRADRHLVAFPRALLIRDGGRFRDDVDAEALFRRPVFAPSAPLAAAFLLERGARTSLEPISRAAFAMQVASRVAAAGTGLDRFVVLISLLEGVACMRLTIADPVSAADAVVSLVA